MLAQLIETWSIHDRINLYLLAAVAPESLTAISASKGRSVGAQFAHMHNVRLTWLKQAAPEQVDGQVDHLAVQADDFSEDDRHTSC